MALSFGAAAAVSPLPHGSFNGYWGQLGSDNVADYCRTGVPTVTVGFVNNAPEADKNTGYPGTNFAGHCWGTYYMKNGKQSQLLKDCPTMVQGIKECRDMGVKVILSIGGVYDSNSNYIVSTAANGRSFADFLWSAFGPYDPKWTGPRPMDGPDYHNTIDGFDFDLEYTVEQMQSQKISNDPYIAMVEQFRKHKPDMYISAAPQCPTADAWFPLKSLIQKAQFDALNIQFYNNPSCNFSPSNVQSNYDDWTKILDRSDKSKNAKIFVTLPASPQAASNGYIPVAKMREVVCKNSGKKHWGGLGVWELSWGATNVINGHTYAEHCLQALRDGGCGPEQPFPTTTTSKPVTTSTSIKTTTSKPVTTSTSIKTTTSKPVTTSTSIKTTTSSTSSTPVTTTTTTSEKPVTTTTTTSEEPVTTTTTTSEKPVTTTTTTSEEPVTTTTTTSEEPVTTTTTTSEEPVTTTTSEEPLTTTTTTSEEPVTTTTSEEPVTTTTSEEPVTTTTSEEPVTTTTSEEPVTTTTSEEPVTTTTSEEPVTTTTSEEPVTTTTSEEPVTTTTSEKPVTTTTSEKPVTTSTEGPVTTSSAVPVTTSTAIWHNTTHSTGPTSSESVILTTSIVYTTSVHTVTACPPQVTNCPTGHVTTETIPLYTTICPVTATHKPPKPTSKPATKTRAPWTTSTVFTTHTYTVTACPPEVTNCPTGHVTTETVPWYTTICPVTETEEPTTTTTATSTSTRTVTISRVSSAKPETSSIESYTSIHTVEVVPTPPSSSVVEETTAQTPEATQPASTGGSGCTGPECPSGVAVPTNSWTGTPGGPSETLPPVTAGASGLTVGFAGIIAMAMLAL